jgi:chromosomal replication initiation ATPase DnaA
MTTQQISRIDMAEEMVSLATGIGRDAITSRTRQQEVCEARHICWYIQNKIHGYSKSAIGRKYGVCHTTVMDGINRIEKKQILADILKELKIKIKS